MDALLDADAPVTAFDHQRLVARGPLFQVLDVVARYQAREAGARLTIFHDATGTALTLDQLEHASRSPRAAAPLGSTPMTSANVNANANPGPGRPRLGVVAREVTLLPEHWRWLAGQPGGASAALRRLIDDARAGEAMRERRRSAHHAAWQCLSTLGAGLAAVDEALVAIFTGDLQRFEQCSLTWPVDVRDYLRELGFGVARGI